jgi:hypothetical protein
VSHHTTPDFWACYQTLPREVQALADKSFDLLKDDSKHPSLHPKKVGRFWSARVGMRHRAVAVEGPMGLVWFWIGTHREYENAAIQIACLGQGATGPAGSSVSYSGYQQRGRASTRFAASSWQRG